MQPEECGVAIVVRGRKGMLRRLRHSTETTTAGLGERGFDPGAAKVLQAGRWENHGIPHGWGFILQQVLGGRDLIPIVPVFVNTFYAANQPTASRCYDFGVALGAAIKSFPQDLRVGVVASGGLSHFVIDEDVDRGLLQALTGKDKDFMVSLKDDELRSGTSELRNWVAVGGAIGRHPPHRPGHRLPAVLPLGSGDRLRDGLHGMAAVDGRGGPRTSAARGLACSRCASCRLLLFVWPVAMLAYGTLRTAPPGQGGRWSTSGLTSALTSWDVWHSFINSLILSAATVALSTALAIYLAWLVTRTRTPLRQIVTPVAVLIFAVPPMFYTLSWAMLGQQPGGLIDKALHGMFGAAPVNVQSWYGLIIVSVLGATAAQYLLLLGPFLCAQPRPGGGVAGLRRQRAPLGLPDRDPRARPRRSSA